MHTVQKEVEGEECGVVRQPLVNVEEEAVQRVLQQRPDNNP